MYQWRIQDFVDGGWGRQHQTGGGNLLFGQLFPKNCMKMKEIGPRGGVPRASLDPPMSVLFYPYAFLHEPTNV